MLRAIDALCPNRLQNYIPAVQWVPEVSCNGYQKLAAMGTEVRRQVEDAIIIPVF